MEDNSPGGPRRLRGAGIGSAVGGVTIAVLSVLLPYAPAAAATVGVGVLTWVRNRGGGSVGLGLGCAAVGGIGLLEAFGLGLGVGPLFLGAIAVGAGIIDVVVGGALGRFQPRT